MNIITISGSHGAGKDVILQEVLNKLNQEYPGLVKQALYTTTRKPQPNDKEGVTAHFCSKEKFQKMVDAGEFIYHLPIGDYEAGTTWDEFKKSEFIATNVNDENARKLREYAAKENGKTFLIYLHAPEPTRFSRIKSRDMWLFDEPVNWKMEHDPTNSNPENHRDFDFMIENPEGQLEKTTEAVYAEVKKFIEAVKGSNK